MNAKVLVVDDKEMMRDSVGSTLRRAGFEIVVASNGEDALGVMARDRPDVVVTDLKMPGMTGLELLERVSQLDDELPVVLMTAFGTIETAVEAMRFGAFDYVTKPFEGDELIITIKRALRHVGLVRENAVLRLGGHAPSFNGNGTVSGTPEGPIGTDRLVGDSPAIRRVREQVQAVASSQGTVLVTGESGTGKEVVARAIHELSPRIEGAFLAVNCAALSESLLESELFGHERGAFTGADRLRKGRFELAHNGTLLLDEVSEVGAQIQAKLLRVLQERAFERVGSSSTIGVDVRVVATSNRDLPAAAEAGDFRQDLFFRLNVLPIHLPPMRERLEDVPVLVSHFSSLIAAREGRPTPVFEDAALDLLGNYRWPGNVRELQNICERAVVITASRGESQVRRDLIEPWLLAEPRKARRLDATTNGNGHAPQAMVEPKMALAGEKTLADIEREAIVTTLQRFGGHRAKTAKALGIGVRTLGLKLKKWKECQLVPMTL
ncbi:MAG: DNA-binding NtrC family response regulator [Phycisphaerales bacterium]|jgi:DNA-binding NtrC family response regulator